jgi:hypothetical protein
VVAVAGLAGYELRGSGPAQPAAVAPGSNQLARLAAEAALSSGTRTAHLTTADDRPVADVVVQADGTGYLVGKQVDRLPDGRTYQLWAVAKGQKLSVGVLGPNVDVAAFRLDPKAVDALAITNEASPGVVASSNPPVAYGLLGASSGGTATTTP